VSRAVVIVVARRARTFLLQWSAALGTWVLRVTSAGGSQVTPLDYSRRRASFPYVRRQALRVLGRGSVPSGRWQPADGGGWSFTEEVTPCA
jgi:hypothetical protein